MMEWKLVPKVTSLSFQQMSVRSVVNLSYKVMGKVLDPAIPPILILHGLLQTKYLWNGCAKTINNVTKRAVVTLDLRNHGDSPYANSHKYKDLAEDVIDLLDKIHHKKVTLIGHGMGGNTAMYLALMEPKRITNLIIVDQSPCSSCPIFTRYYLDVLTSMKKISFKENGKPLRKVFKAKKIARSKLKEVINDEFMLRMITSAIAVTREGSIGFKFNLDALINDFKEISRFPLSGSGNKFFGPTYFIGGQLSDNIPPDDLTKIREIFPRSVVSYVRGARHNVFIDDPHHFLEVVIRFLRHNNVGYVKKQHILI